MKPSLLSILLLILSVACTKKTIIEKQDPEIVSFNIKSDNSTGTNRPKLTFQAKVTDNVETLYLVRYHQNETYTITGIDSVATIQSPISKEYSVIDMTTTYPYSDKSIYIFSFRLKDAGIIAFTAK